LGIGSQGGLRLSCNRLTEIDRSSSRRRSCYRRCRRRVFRRDVSRAKTKPGIARNRTRIVNAGIECALRPGNTKPTTIKTTRTATQPALTGSATGEPCQPATLLIRRCGRSRSRHSTATAKHPLLGLGNATNQPISFRRSSPNRAKTANTERC